MGRVWNISCIPARDISSGVRLLHAKTLSLSHTQSSHQHLKLTKINTFGLVYEWTGSNSTLKPVLLASHQGVSYLPRWHSYLTESTDTVPVNPRTIHEWTYPPWSGHYDGQSRSLLQDEPII